MKSDAQRWVRLEDKPYRYRLLETCPVRGVLVEGEGQGPVWVPLSVVRVADARGRLAHCRTTVEGYLRDKHGEVGE